MTDGYDHILEIETYENIMDVVAARNQDKMLTILRTIPTFEVNTLYSNSSILFVNSGIQEKGKKAYQGDYKHRWARLKCNPQQMTSLKSTYQLV